MVKDGAVPRRQARKHQTQRLVFARSILQGEARVEQGGKLRREPPGGTPADFRRR
jgi:hypothetical protein